MQERILQEQRLVLLLDVHASVSCPVWNSQAADFFREVASHAYFSVDEIQQLLIEEDDDDA